MSAGLFDCGDCVNPVMGCARRCARGTGDSIVGTEDEQVDDLFQEQQLPAAEQIRLAQEAVDAVNRLVDAQFTLSTDVLNHAVQAQVECYRALHMARQVKA